MRILTVGNMYPPHHAGGYEMMWQAAVRRARELGHLVRIVATDYRSDNATHETDPAVYRTLRWYWDLDRYEFPQLSPLDRLRVERHNAHELERHLAEFRPDVVSWWSMGCMSLSLIERVRQAGTPAVFVVHDDWLVYGRHYDQWIRMWRGWRKTMAPAVERLCRVPTKLDLSAAGRFVFNSRYTLERARAAGLETRSAQVVYPGIGERFLEACPPHPWRWRFAYVGRIDRQKGVDVAVRALARLAPTAVLSVWGTGDDRYLEELQQLAGRLGLRDRVRFEGWADRDQLVRIYTDADAVLFPVRWEEPFGLVPLEAMGIGRPVVTTARGGTAEFVQDEGNALVFAAEDDAGLAHAIERLARDPRLRERICEGGRRTAARFTVPRFAKGTVQEIVRAAEADGWPPKRL